MSLRPLGFVLGLDVKGLDIGFSFPRFGPKVYSATYDLQPGQLEKIVAS